QYRGRGTMALMARWAQLVAALAGPLWLLWLLVVACLFLQATPAGAASEPWRIDDLAVVADPAGGETIASISQPGRAADFEPVPDGFSGGYTRAVHWLRFTLHAPPANADGKREMLLEIHPPYIDDLQIYVSQSAGEPFDVRRGGDLQPQSAKEIAYRGYVYRFVFEDDRPRTAYVRLQTHSSSVLSGAARASTGATSPTCSPRCSTCWASTAWRASSCCPRRRTGPTSGSRWGSFWWHFLARGSTCSRSTSRMPRRGCAGSIAFSCGWPSAACLRPFWASARK
ncbi:MAG: hypothetical protein EOO29_21920, partial [Comamonadaceae bacterium]